MASAFPDNLASLNDLLNGTEEALVVFEPALKIAEPVRALLTDFEREYFTVLAIEESAAGDATVAHQRLLAVQTLDHQITAATHQLIPAIYIPSAKLPAARSLISELQQFPNSQIDPIQYLILGLVRRGEQIRVLEIDSLPPADSNPNKLRLQLANRSNDGFFSTFVLRKISKVFTRVALNLKLKPNFITVVSFLVGVFAAIEFSRSNYISGAIFLQFSLILDCVDGEVARYTKQFSRFGAWLDALSDRVKEFMAIGGLAYSVQGSVKNIWLLATLALILQTVK
ncbi:MAG: CDP-alcohol phosphatidyltransferase family protein, partial [Actinobacteria bacterium]|nr:CDP-alcohol phosphatidyltransferase family protein [Actinomycetota bacterium]